MPTTELLGAKQVGVVTGEAFTITSAGAGKGVILTPLAATGGKGGVITHQVILKTAEVEGLTRATAAAKAAGAKTATAKTAAVAGKAAAVKGAAAKGAVPALVEIEGAGKVMGAGGGKGGTAINALQLNGVLKPGAKGSQVLLQGGEVKIANGPLATKAAAMAKPVTAKGAAAAKGVAGAAAAGTTGAAAVGQTAAAKTGAAGATGAEVVTSGGGGTIWTGKGFSLGLGWGLGAWGPVLLAGGLAAVGVGIYSYMKREQGGELEEVTS